MITVSQLITAVEEIAAEEPRYQLGHDGSDGLCDCVGLIIGAIRRAGGQWRGMHGSNYAARAEVRKLLPITGSSVLRRGEAVFKAYEPGVGGYNLPERYSPGGNSYTGDLRDYYHVGIVESVYPLRIRHMTSPRPKTDISLGKWSYHGELIKVDYDADGSGKDEKMDKVIISGGNVDAPIHLRKAASTASPIVAEISQGSTAELIEGGGAWNQIRWNGKTGYVMTKFVRPYGSGSGEDTGEMISVPKAELEKIYDELGDWLGLRG